LESVKLIFECPKLVSVDLDKTISETLEEIYIAAKSTDANTVDAAMQIAKKRLGHIPAQ
jgi:predicted transport protein